MTDAQAKSIISTWYQTTLAGNDDTYTGFTENEWMSLEQAITAALDAREREVWEKAAQEWDAYANSDKKLKAGKTFADVCRQKGNGS